MSESIDSLGKKLRAMSWCWWKCRLKRAVSSWILQVPVLDSRTWPVLRWGPSPLYWPWSGHFTATVKGRVTVAIKCYQLLFPKLLYHVNFSSLAEGYRGWECHILYSSILAGESHKCCLPRAQGELFRLWRSKYWEVREVFHPVSVLGVFRTLLAWHRTYFQLS